MKFSIPKEHARKSGIYVIRNSLNKKVYVGSAINLLNRFRSHRQSLRTGVHKNVLLQRFGQKHGIDCLSFELLELVDDKFDLIAREQHWMDTFKSYDVKQGYNLSPTAGSPLGVKWSDDMRKRQSVLLSGERNPRYGKPITKTQSEALLKANAKSVVCSKDGVVVKIYARLRDVEKDGFDRSEVGELLNGKSRNQNEGLHRGYSWSKPTGSELIVEQSVAAIPEGRKRRFRAIVSCDTQGNIIKRYARMKDVANDGFDQGAVSRAANGKLKQHKGLLWRFD